MTEKELDEQLQQYTDLKAERRQLESMSAELRRTRALIPGTASAMREILKYYSVVIRRLQRTESAIERSISYCHDPVLYSILNARYIGGKTWEQIAEQENYSLTHIFRLKRAGLQLLLKGLKK